MAACSSRRMPRRTRAGLLCPLCLLLLFGPSRASASPGIAYARVDTLYEAAAYEQALRAALEALAQARADDGTDAESLIGWLVRVGRCRTRLSQFAEADTVLVQAAAIDSARSGEPDSTTLELRRALSWLERERWKPDAMVRSASGVVDLARSIYGPADSRIAADLVALANVLIDLDRQDEAVSHLDEAERLAAQKVGGGETMAAVLAARAEIASSNGDLDRAIALLERAVESVQDARGADHPSLGPYLRGLGEVRRLHGDLDEAERCFRRILEIEIAVFGRGHPRTGMSLNNLGVVLSNKGDLSGAEDAYERSLEVRIAGSGEENPDVALTMVNLSSLKQALGKEAEGLRLLRRAVRITESAMGPGHTRTAWAMSHLAQAERRCGRPREGERLFGRCLAIAETIHGPTHVDAALYRIGIAQCLRDEGRLDEALVEFRKADSIGTALLGPENHQVARYRREVGVTLLLLGRVGEARAVLEKCAVIIERELGPEHPAMNHCLAGLTIAAIRRGDLTQARELADRNLSAAERTFGESGLRRSLLMKLAVEVAAGDGGSAAAVGLRASETALQMQDDLLQVSSEREMLLYAEHGQRALGLLLGALEAASGLPDSIVDRVFSLAARQHGQMVDRFAERRGLIELAADTSAGRSLYDRLRIASERLAACVAAGPRGNRERYLRTLAEAREEKAKAERDLADVFSDPRLRTDHSDASERLDPGDVSDRLGSGTILIQYVRFPVLSVHTAAWRPGASSLEEALSHGCGDHYGAFRLTRAAPGQTEVEFADLGPAEAIDSLVTSYRRSIVAVRPGRRPTVPQENAYRVAARNLREAVWAPLIDTPSAFADAAGEGEPPLVFLVPASCLHWVDFNTLVDRDGRTLLEDWKLHTLSSVRDLFRESGDRQGGGRLLSVGNPEGSLPRIPCLERNDPSFPLPGAEGEAREIAAIYTQSRCGDVVLLTGRDATESAVKIQLERAGIAHLATHGFYCEDARFDEADAEEVALDPLLRCGLVLAPGDKGDDGLLTAQEIVARDLSDLDWVVLSACDSGLGPLVSGEGFYGLRRAFEIAGARTVIAAIWSIGDRSTRELMRAVFENRLRGYSTTDALRLAQIERLCGSRRQNRIHPASWGGLIAEGDWR